MGEITLNDPFGRAIASMIECYKFQQNLEIGSWDGTGSTQCFIRSMEGLEYPKNLYCIEVDVERLEALIKNVVDYDFVVPVGISSICGSDWIVSDFEKDVWQSPYNKIDKHRYGKELVRSWYDATKEVMDRSKQGFLDINKDRFDSVLIDGSAFTGYSEFVLLKDRARCFFLDDVHKAFKCNQIHHELLLDPAWELMYDFPEIRMGASIFLRRKK